MSTRNRSSMRQNNKRKASGELVDGSSKSPAPTANEGLERGSPVVKLMVTDPPASTGTIPSDSDSKVKVKISDQNQDVPDEPQKVICPDGKVRHASLSRQKTINLDFLQPSKDTTKAVNIAVASRSLFKIDMDFNPEDEDATAKQKMDDYLKLTIANEKTPFSPGAAFPFISALSNVNKCLLKIDPKEQERFNVILMSHNHAHVGVRLINSVNHHDLHIERMCLTGGTTPVPDYLEAYNVSLFLTSYPKEVELALENGFAAAVMSDQLAKDSAVDQLRVAFDLDAVLFSDAAELQYKSGGLSAFFKYERERVNEPCEEGPLKNFAQALGRMQQKFYANKHIIKESPIRIYIVTARSAASSGERAIKTLREWGLHIDEIHFLAGASKGPILNAIKPHIFFDDQHVHIASAMEYGIVGAQVPNDSRYRPRTPVQQVRSKPVEKTPSKLVSQSPAPHEKTSSAGSEAATSPSSTADMDNTLERKAPRLAKRNLSLVECDSQDICTINKHNNQQ